MMDEKRKKTMSASEQTIADKRYMEMAIELARRGAGKVNPNPMVGAVIVKDGRVIGRGYHQKYGSLHAERNALKNCVEDPSGAAMYVTLEPCCHYGKTPPCTQAIIEAGISRVVVGTADPNPKMSGRSLKTLRDHGMEVNCGVLKEQCDDLIKIFRKYITTGLPYVTMKYAMTLDGKIAAYTGRSQWITGEEARRHTHETRNLYSGIMAGVETVIKDDPLLTCRITGGRDPIRIICDSRLRTPLGSRIVKTAADVRTIIATCEDDIRKHLPFTQKGCRIIVTGSRDGMVDLRELMLRLGTQDIDSVLLEGGGSLNWSAMDQHIVDSVQAYIAPMIMGGEKARSPVEGLGHPSPDLAVRLKNMKITAIGTDYLAEGEVVY